MDASFVWVFVAIGIFLRAVLPYLIERQKALDDGEEGLAWDKKFWLPPLFSAVIALISLPLAMEAMPPDLSVWGALAFGLVGWGGSDLVRLMQKTAFS